MRNIKVNLADGSAIITTSNLKTQMEIRSVYMGDVYISPKTGQSEKPVSIEFLDTDLKPIFDNRRKNNLSAEKRTEIGRMGGKALATKNPAHMAAIGRIGGSTISRNREHMARIGQLGGRGKKKDESK